MAIESQSPSGKVIRAQHVRFTNGKHDRTHQSAPEPSQNKESKIILIRDGDTVTAIEVHCGCGAVIRLDCQY